MKVLSQGKERIINDEFEFYISNTKSPITSIYCGDKFMGLYEKEYARKVIAEIADAMKKGEVLYCMPSQEFGVEEFAELWGAMIDIVCQEKPLFYIFRNEAFPMTLKEDVFEITMYDDSSCLYAEENIELIQNAFNMLLGKEYTVEFGYCREADVPFYEASSDETELNKLLIKATELIAAVAPEIRTLQYASTIVLADGETVVLVCHNSLALAIANDFKELLKDAFTLLLGTPYDIEICDKNYYEDCEDDYEDEEYYDKDNEENEEITEEEKK